jgi:hypothetical protein
MNVHEIVTYMIVVLQVSCVKILDECLCKCYTLITLLFSRNKVNIEKS